MAFIKIISIALLLVGFIYEIVMMQYAYFANFNHWLHAIVEDMNNMTDLVVPVYGAIVVFACIYYEICRSSNHEIKHYPSIKKAGQENWKVTMQGTWHQFEAEGLEEFGDLTDDSQMRRTLGAIAFFKVRHTITISGGYFNLMRDFGMSISVWNLRAKIGKDRDSAEPVLVEVETGGKYCFRVWLDDEKEKLYMESAPGEGQEGITTLQTRSLLSRDEMQMVSVRPLVYFSNGNERITYAQWNESWTGLLCMCGLRYFLL